MRKIMNNGFLNGLLISDFNVELLANYLNNSDDLPGPVNAVAASFGQVIPVLMDPAQYLNNPNDFLVVWTQPERIFASFKNLMEFEDVSIKEVNKEVDDFCQLLCSLKSNIPGIFVMTWMLPTYYHKNNILQDMKTQRGLSYFLMKMNSRLIENLEESRNIHVLNSQNWVRAAGRNAFNSKMWYAGKIPYDPQVFKEAAQDIKSALRGIRGMTRKLVLVDLDDTLWGGTVGDVGWENIQLGGHDPVGEALVDFQRSLKMLKKQGVLLGIISKNDESTALEAIRCHPEMVLKKEDFVGWRINWKDKHSNVVDLVKELNLGLDSVVFIDDNPYEQAQVRDLLPEVFVPPWPDDKLQYRKTLLSLACFDAPYVTKEDLERSSMCEVERGRKKLLAQVGSAEEWVKQLGVRVKVEELNKTNLMRTVQLLNKTNQMNLSTRRMVESELWDWAGQPSRKLWTFRVVDKFCDAGLTGIVSLETEGPVGRIVDLVLSCRVFGRKVEEAMLSVAYAYAKRHAVTQLQARYVPTPRNKPCLEFLQRSGLQEGWEINLFTWDMARAYPATGIMIDPVTERNADDSAAPFESIMR
jgi:FkbH-like protein